MNSRQPRREVAQSNKRHARLPGSHWASRRAGVLEDAVAAHIVVCHEAHGRDGAFGCGYDAGMSVTSPRAWLERESVCVCVRFYVRAADAWDNIAWKPPRKPIGTREIGCRRDKNSRGDAGIPSRDQDVGACDLWTTCFKTNIRDGANIRKPAAAAVVHRARGQQHGILQAMHPHFVSLSHVAGVDLEDGGDNSKAGILPNYPET